MTTPINHPHWQEDPWEIKLSDAPIIGRDGYQYSAEDPDKTSDGQDLRDDFGWGLVEAIGNLLEAIATPIGEILAGIGDFAGTVFNAVVDGVGKLLEDITGFVKYTFDFIFGETKVGEVGPRFSPFKDDVDGALAPFRQAIEENLLIIDDHISELEQIQQDKEDQLRKNEELEAQAEEALEAAVQVTTNLANYRRELLEAIGPELDRAKNELEEAKAGLVTREELTGELETVGENQEGLFLEMAEASFEDFDGTFQDFITLWRDQQIEWNDTQQLVNDKQLAWNKAADNIEDAQNAAIDAQTRILNMVFPAQSAVPLIPGELTPEWYDKAIKSGFSPSSISPPSGAKDKEHFVQATGQVTSWYNPEHYAKVVPGQRYRATMWVRSSSSSSNAQVEVRMRGLNSDETVDNNPVWKLAEVRPNYEVGGYKLDQERIISSSSAGFSMLGFSRHPLSTGWKQLEVWVYFKESVEQVAVRRIDPNINGTSYTMRIGDLQIWPDLPAQTKVDEGQNMVMQTLEEQIKGLNEYVGLESSGSGEQNSLNTRLLDVIELQEEAEKKQNEFIPRYFYGKPGSHSGAMGSELLTVSNPSTRQVRITGKKTSDGESWTGKGVIFWYRYNHRLESGMYVDLLEMKDVSFRSGSSTTITLDEYSNTTVDRNTDRVFIAWQMTKGRHYTAPRTASGPNTLSNNKNSMSTLVTVNIPSNAEIESVKVSYWLQNAHHGSEYGIGFEYGGSRWYHYTNRIGPATPLGSGKRLMEYSWGRTPNNGGTTIKLIGYGLHSGTSQRQWADAKITVKYVVPA